MLSAAKHDKILAPLARIFVSMQFTRHLDRSGYIRFQRWRFYAEARLARQKVQVHMYTSTLKLEYEETELAFYTIARPDCRVRGTPSKGVLCYAFEQAGEEPTTLSGPSSLSDPNACGEERINHASQRN